jgi:histidinol-phosphatase (PHP family)
VPEIPPLADNHVHSQFSWDATHGDMEATCRRAVELGLPSIAFTEHLDWVRGTSGVFDPSAYFYAIDHCRTMFPDLRILAGVEMGEPHRYPKQARELLALPFERRLGSVHCVDWNGHTTDASERGFLTPKDCDAIFRLYLAEVLALVESNQQFQVLAHLDYPKRYWPASPAYDAAVYEDEFRSVLRAAAKRDLVLELNTTRGREPERYLCPGPVVLGWWREEGGRAISFGSDAHSPDVLAAGFAPARDVANAAGFKPQDDPTAFWLR